MTAPGLKGESDDAGLAQEPEAAQAAPDLDPGPPRSGVDHPGERADQPWRRLSRRSMIVRPLTDLVRLLPLLAGLVILHTKAGAGLAWGGAAAALAVVTGLVHWA